MARPWPKKSAWPYVAKSGRRSYTLGFYDHDRVERSRAFPSVKHARDWMDDFITAERRGRDSLRRFLLDLDAKEANEAEARSIGELLELYLAVNAQSSTDAAQPAGAGQATPPLVAAADQVSPAGRLSPHAIEAIREQMLLRVENRDPILAHRDTVIVSMQYGLGARNQEVWGMRWMSLDEDFTWVIEVLSHGQLDE